MRPKIDSTLVFSTRLNRLENQMFQERPYTWLISKIECNAYLAILDKLRIKIVSEQCLPDSKLVLHTRLTPLENPMLPERPCIWLISNIECNAYLVMLQRMRILSRMTRHKKVRKHHMLNRENHLTCNQIMTALLEIQIKRITKQYYRTWV